MTQKDLLLTYSSLMKFNNTPVFERWKDILSSSCIGRALSLLGY